MGKKIWQMHTSFLETQPGEAFRQVCEDDSAIYTKAQSEFGQEIELLDRGITLLISILQGAYLVKDKWLNESHIRAAIAMAAAFLNGVLLIRHALLLGYMPEAVCLLRYCHERTTRCLAFLGNRDLANKFLSDKEIKQPEVDGAIKELDDEFGEKAFKGLRGIYSDLSELSHPNLRSFSLRYPLMNPVAEVGSNITVGGIQSKGLGQASILWVMLHILTPIRVLQSKFKSSSGESEQEYEAILKLVEELKQKLSKET